MSFYTTHDLEDWENFHYTNSPQPVRSMESSIETLPYYIPTFADISSTCVTYCCIGKIRHGILANPYKTVLSNHTRPSLDPFLLSFLKSDNAWSEAETLVKLARSCLCEDCCTAQLLDVIVAWIKEIETPVERTRCRADSVVDHEEMTVMLQVVRIAPVETLVAASVATREVFSKVFGFWSGSGRTLYN
jgi:hypothetical protein